MTIRSRIILLVALTFVALSLIGGYSVIQSRSNAKEVRGVTEGVVTSALASADLVSLLKEVQLTTMALVSAPDTTIAAQARDKLLKQQLQLKESLDFQAHQATGSAQTGLVDQAKESLANYFGEIDQTAQLKLAGQTSLAEANLFANVAQYQREMEQIVDALRVEKNRSKDSAIAALNDSLSNTVTTISAVSLATILALGVVGYLLYRQVVLPIGRMQAMMSEIADSQDFSRRLPVGGKDEIGRSIGAFNVMVAKIEESSGLLRQKTTDIQTMLQHMPQGILTIAAGNRVHPEYSAFLESILETADIAGRDVMELVFADTDLGADALSQVEAAVGACIGEDAMNFEFNAHLLVGEIEKRLAGGRTKVLDLNWSPIVDDNNTVVRLLLCVRDVTELRRLAAEAREQKRELELIGEILAVSQEKFHEFIASALKFIDENEQLIRATPKQDADVVAQLFRNMHTIKGNARTYGLRHLTNTVHGAEQIYDELRKPRPTVAWDSAALLEQLAAVRAEVEQYAKINEVSLGRKGPGRRGGERYLLVDREQIQETLHRLEKVNPGNLHELVAARDQVQRVLRLLGTESVAQILSGVFDSLPSLAKELGKVAPVVSIEDNGYFLHNQVSGALKNVFMHLVRNAMDHGIETPDVRRESGKPAAGEITLRLALVGDGLQLALSDDGRGLALARIRRIALDKQLIGADDVLSDEEVAQLIFRPGFSTAEAVTEVSGRGVGMDAVQDLIRREGGKIAVRFLDDAAGADFRRFETVVTLPEKVAVRGEEIAVTADAPAGSEDGAAAGGSADVARAIA
ncbi:ATP-binding protein [Oryzomicrobium sp.]|uniref:ATP-binding protein n=1 Tax=Oryzomicrobium sp. TaxID=1911578 RepID=UPI002FE02EDD